MEKTVHIQPKMEVQERIFRCYKGVSGKAKKDNETS